MVFAILVETTSPISVLRRPAAASLLVFVASVVSAMTYFVSVAAVFLVAAFFTFAGLLAATAGAAVFFTVTLATAPLPAAIFFSRSMVFMRAMSFFRSRIF